MSLFTSSKFASAAASGTDWRDTAKAVLEKLDSLKSKDHNFNLGFIYITDHLAEDSQSIINLFSSVLNIKNWVGTIGLGVCGNGEGFLDRPAISAMIGCFDKKDFQVFPATGLDTSDAEEKLRPWLKHEDSMLVFVHGDPMAEEDPALTLKRLNGITNGFMVGGLSSSRHQHMQFANGIEKNGVSGVAFSQAVKVATTLSQGCNIIGEGPHNITLCDEDTIMELDGKKAVDVFENDLRIMAIKKIDRDPDTVLIHERALEDEGALPEEFRGLMKGEVHVAFSVSESDQNDYLVRNIVELDADSGSMTVAHHLSSGERAMFVHRDEESVQQDLSKSLLALRGRVERDTGSFEPKGALYVSCIARAFSERGAGISGEMELIRDVIGDLPLAGFYAGGEVCNARLYGYTGILTLFL